MRSRGDLFLVLVGASASFFVLVRKNVGTKPRTPPPLVSVQSSPPLSSSPFFLSLSDFSSSRNGDGIGGGAMAFRLVVLVVVGRIRFLVLTPCVGTKADTVPGGATKVVAAKPAAAAVKRVRLGMVFFGLCYQGPAVSEYGTVDWPPTVLLEQCGFYSGACVRRVKKRCREDLLLRAVRVSFGRRQDDLLASGGDQGLHALGSPLSGIFASRTKAIFAHIHIEVAQFLDLETTRRWRAQPRPAKHLYVYVTCLTCLH